MARVAASLLPAAGLVRRPVWRAGRHAGVRAAAALAFTVFAPTRQPTHRFKSGCRPAAQVVVTRGRHLARRMGAGLSVETANACLATLEGHTDYVNGVACCTLADGSVRAIASAHHIAM